MNNYELIIIFIITWFIVKKNNIYHVSCKRNRRTCMKSMKENRQTYVYYDKMFYTEMGIEPFMCYTLLDWG